MLKKLMLISTIQNVTRPNYSNALYGYNNKNELQTHTRVWIQDICKKSTVLTKTVFREHSTQ